MCVCVCFCLVKCNLRGSDHFVSRKNPASGHVDQDATRQFGLFGLLWSCVLCKLSCIAWFFGLVCSLVWLVCFAACHTNFAPSDTAPMFTLYGTSIFFCVVVEGSSILLFLLVFLESLILCKLLMLKANGETLCEHFK